MTSTKISGDTFRDFVGSMLAAAGFKPSNEIRVNHKKVDLVWERYGIDGRTRYLVECKNYTKTLGLDECREFKEDYRDLIANGEADYAWLISKGDISPDGRASVEAVRGLKCFTFAEFQRRLYGADAYLNKLISSYEASGIDKWYVEIFDKENKSLEKIVRDWLVENGAPPLAFIAGYGKGKSTFASRLASLLAAEAMLDKTARIPVLIPLGSIMDEQSLEGLLGKAFSVNAETYGYNFGLFEKLNEAGNFVIFFDGFDEMKHGMTLAKFEMMIRELMRLDTGAAKIVILGRDTAFHDDVEFRSIIHGRQKTTGGNEVRISGRREFRAISIRDFTVNEAIKFINGFFPAFAMEANRHGGLVTDDWIKARVAEITSNEFHSLIVRPVHARMLCQVATDPSVSLSGLSKYGLFDRFLHFLLDREVQKRGRDPQFGIDIRRRTNALIALWLWEQGGASTVSISEIPVSIFSAAVTDIRHNYDEHSLKRELVQGCLLDKGSEAVFFGHRSLQEFLVADAIRTLGLQRSLSEMHTMKIMAVLNAEICNFITEGVVENSEFRDAVSFLMKNFSKFRNVTFSHVVADFVLGLISSGRVDVEIFSGTPWYPYLLFFKANESASYVVRKPEAFAAIRTLLEKMRSEDAAFQAATIFLLSIASGDQNRIEDEIAAWLPHSSIERALERGHYRGEVKMIFYEADEDLPFWLMLSCCKPVWQNGLKKVELLEVDLGRLASAASAHCSVDFDIGIIPVQGVIRIPLVALFRAWNLNPQQTLRMMVFFSEEFWNSMRAKPSQKNMDFGFGGSKRIKTGVRLAYKRPTLRMPNP
jgi:hypothetical protein